MAKALRWVGLAAAGLGALLLIAIGVIVFLLARLDMRAEIERAVERSTGRELAIAGDVGFTFWPVLGFSAQDAALANVEGGRAASLAAIDKLNVGVEIAPLFRRQVQVRSIVLERPVIALEVDSEGAPNWVLTPQPRAQPGPDIDLGEPPEFSLREVRVVDGRVSFFDARRNSVWEIGDADLETALTSMDEPVRVEGALDYREQRVDVEFEIGSPRAAIAGAGTPVKAVIDGALLELSFEGQTIAAAGELSGVASANGPSVKELAAWLGAPMEGVRGFERFTISGNVRSGDGQLAFENAAFTLDALAGRGDFVLMTIRAKPYVSGRVEIFDFDLNPYLTDPPPPAAPGVATAAAAAPARALDVEQAASEAPIDFSGLRAINCDLEITAGALKVQRITTGRAMLGLVLNDGFLAATLHQMSLYGGSGTGRIEIDAREADTRIRQELGLQNVDASTFLSDAINLSNLEGNAQVTLGVSAQGRTQSQFLGSADGRVHIEVVSGALRGVDLGGVARTIRNALAGELVSPNARTPFQGFSADFAIADGVLASDTLSFNTPDLRITGVGVIDVPARRLDMRLAPRSPRGGIVVPFSIRGSWDALSYDSDLRDRALREIQARVNQVEASN